LLLGFHFDVLLLPGKIVYGNSSKPVEAIVEIAQSQKNKLIMNIAYSPALLKLPECIVKVIYRYKT